MQLHLLLPSLDPRQSLVPGAKVSLGCSELVLQVLSIIRDCWKPLHSGELDSQAPEELDWPPVDLQHCSMILLVVGLGCFWGCGFHKTHGIVAAHQITMATLLPAHQWDRCCG